MRTGIGIGTRFTKPLGGFDPVFNLPGTQGLGIAFHKSKAVFTDTSELDFADTDTDNIASVRDFGDNALDVTVAGTGNTLRSDSVMGSYLSFTNGNSNMQFKGSKTALRHLHTNKTWDLCFWVKVATIQACTFFDSTQRSSAGCGIDIELKSNGTIYGVITRNSGGTNVYNITTIATLPTNDWVMIRVKHEVDSAPTIQLFTDDGATAQAAETWSTGNGAYVANGTDSTDDLVFGSRSNNLTVVVYDDDLAGIFLQLDSLYTDAEIANIRAWRAERDTTTSNLLQTISDWETDNSRAITGLVSDHHFGDVSKLWQDSIGGTAVSSEDDPIGVVEPQWDGVADSTLERVLTASSTDRPVYKPSSDTGNDEGAALFTAATPSSLDHSTNNRFPKGAQCYRVYAIRSTVTGSAGGSRFDSESSSSYLTITSNDYNGSGGDDTRVVQHFSNAEETIYFGKNEGVENGGTYDATEWLIIEAIRDGENAYLGVNGVLTPAESIPDGTYNPTQMGDGNGQHNFGGYVQRRLVYNGVPTTAQRELIVNGLANELGISL